ncbi:MAG: D-tyrosyl-tRNA(Tyr) deacylase [Acidimicrobiales bacterium]|nr:D-tyrosyl-tRNA(Tyr) deacylase [Acidimicrobiales bacterium]
MRALVQRVARANVRVDDEVVAEVGTGLCVLVGVTHTDDEATARRLAEKLWHLRLFGEGGSAAMERPVAEVGGQVLVVSQFTLYGDTSRGRRPSWVAAAPPERARPLVDELAEELRRLGAHVVTGLFGAHMQLELVNDGPVTLMIEVA